jgi:hypothetical protein
MFKKKNGGKERGSEKGKENLEEQAQNIMQSSDLEELDRVEIPEELRDRVEGADVSALDDLEDELGFNDSVMTPPIQETESGVQAPPPQSEERASETEQQDEKREEAVDASCSVTISDDKMSALISLYPSQHGGKPLDFEMTKNALEGEGVVYGINEDLLKKLIITVEKTHEEKEGIIVAKGLVPEDGKDGVIVYHFAEDEAILEQDNGDNEAKNDAVRE